MKYIVSILIGAVIGYITNWLAIKMLFRPYSEKRFMGVKVPFTPGLIPKEQKRIAKSVGNAVGEYLLSEDTIVETLKKDDVQSSMKNIIKKKFDELCKSTRSIHDILKVVFQDKHTYIIESMSQKISKIIVKSLNDNDVKNMILSSIMEKLKSAASINPSDILKEADIQSIIKSKVTDIRGSSEKKESIKELIQSEIEKIIDKKQSLNDILSSEVSQGVKKYISNNKAGIAEYIRSTLGQPWVEVKIKGIINDTINTKVSPFISMFLKTDSLYVKLMEFADEYLMDEDSQDDIVMILEEAVDTIFHKGIGELLQDEEDVEKAASMITDTVLNDDIINIAADIVDGAISEYDTIDSLIKDFYKDYDKAIDEFMKKSYDDMINSELVSSAIQSKINEILGTIGEMKINDITSGHEESIVESFVDIAMMTVSEMIETEGREAVKIINISKIVEDEINKFPVDMAEKIIVEIADKELKSITWVGALLGGIIGIVTPFISSFL